MAQSPEAATNSLVNIKGEVIKNCLQSYPTCIMEFIRESNRWILQSKIESTSIPGIMFAHGKLFTSNCPFNFLETKRFEQICLLHLRESQSGMKQLSEIIHFGKIYQQKLFSISEINNIPLFKLQILSYKEISR
jgi:hypothetical protein